LAEEFAYLDRSDFDLSMTGFDFKEIEYMTANALAFAEPESLVIEGDVEELTNVMPSNVRMVNLFLNQDSEPTFQEMITQLKERWGANNLTDAVYRAVETCSQNADL